jgi:shikimate dehydrogenase
VNVSPNISGRTSLVGLIGYPLERSVSPAMHNAAFAALGQDYCYVPLRVRPGQLGVAIAGLQALGFAGANVTIPHKERAVACMDTVSEQGQAIGAINTIVVQDAQLCGHNTDWSGSARVLREINFNPTGKRVVVLGAGGAARAVVYALAREQANILILNRTLARAKALVEEFRPQFPLTAFAALPLTDETCFDQIGSAELLVNATPVGMWPHAEASPLPDDAPIQRGLTILDLVYCPEETRLIRQARAVGARTISGLELLVWQGAAAFQLWTGHEPPVEVMRYAAKEALTCCAS